MHVHVYRVSELLPFISGSTIAVDCGPLEQPRNGHVDFILTTYQSLANYSCNNGYKIQNISSRMCQADGNWSGTEPVCFG